MSSAQAILPANSVEEHATLCRTKPVVHMVVMPTFRVMWRGESKANDDMMM